MALKVKAILDADGARFARVMGNAERQVTALAQRMAALFTVGAAVTFGKKIIDYGSRMSDLATQTGLAVEEMQRLDAVARKTGVDIGMLAKAFQSLEYKRAIALSKPGGPEAQAFAQFGFAGDRLRTATPQEMLKAIGGMGTENLTRMTFALRKLFEETGPRMVEAFAVYASAEMQNLTVMSRETVNELDRVADEMAELSRVLMVELAPAIASATENFRVLFQVFADGMKKDGWLAFLIKSSTSGGTFGPYFQGKLTDMFLSSYEKRMREAGGRSQMGGPGAPPVLAPAGGMDADPAKRTIYSDTLTRVGNFLGATSFAVQQVEVQREQLQVQKKILEATEEENQRFDEFISTMNAIFGGGA